MIKEMQDHPVAGGYALLAMAYSLAVAIAFALGFAGESFVVDRIFGHAVPSLMVSMVAFYLNHRFGLQYLGLPKLLFTGLLLGGLVPLVMFGGLMTYYGLGFATFPT